MLSFDPYCGPAPLPGALLSAWNLDPWLLTALAAGFLAAFLLSPFMRIAETDPKWPALSVVVFIIAFVSPLCALSSALFSARIVHHMLLVAVLAPLMALAFPARAAVARLPAGVLFLAHTLLFWIWHAPTPYAFALSSHAAYWLMEGTLFISALILWQRILSPATHPGASLAMLLGSVIQMGMLGALLTFASTALYAPHLQTTVPFGLTPLADQQLAGLIMWVPGALPYLLAAIVIGMGLMKGDPRARQKAGAP